MLRPFLLLLLFSCIAYGGDWDLHRFSGRDYVSLENIADFYGLRSSEDESSHSSVSPAAARKQDLSNVRKEINLRAGSREVIINGVKQWLSFPVREENGKLLLSRIDLAKTVEPMLRPQRIANLRPVQTIVIDAGHGGHDRGAVNALGDEKTYTLDVARRLKKIMEAKGLRVVMTRDRDVFIPLEQRPKVANSIPNSIFVSIHFNSGGPHANGFEIFALTPRGAPSTTDEVLRPRDFREEPGNAVDVQSAALAASVYHSMLGHFVDFDRGLKRARFAVIRLAEVPSILIEGGFISNKEDGQSIHNGEWRQNLAESIAMGIVGFKGLSELHEPPELIADYRRGFGVPWEEDETSAHEDAATLEAELSAASLADAENPEIEGAEGADVDAAVNVALEEQAPEKESKGPTLSSELSALSDFRTNFTTDLEAIDLSLSGTAAPFPVEKVKMHTLLARASSSSSPNPAVLIPSLAFLLAASAFAALRKW